MILNLLSLLLYSVGGVLDMTLRQGLISSPFFPQLLPILFLMMCFSWSPRFHMQEDALRFGLWQGALAGFVQDALSIAPFGTHILLGMVMGLISMSTATRFQRLGGGMQWLCLFAIIMSGWGLQMVILSVVQYWSWNAFTLLRMLSQILLQSVVVWIVLSGVESLK